MTSVIFWELQLRVSRSAFGFGIAFFLLFPSLLGWLRFFLASVPSLVLLRDIKRNGAHNHVRLRVNKVHNGVFYRNDNLNELKLALLSFVCCGVHCGSDSSRQETAFKNFCRSIQKKNDDFTQWQVLIEKKECVNCCRAMVESIRLAHLAGFCSMTPQEGFP